MKYLTYGSLALFLLSACTSEVTVLAPSGGAGGSTSASSSVTNGNATSSASGVVGSSAASGTNATTGGDPPPIYPTDLCTLACKNLDQCQLLRFDECLAGCVPDLADCSPDQFAELIECLDEFTDCTVAFDFMDCIDKVACTDMGDED